MCLQFLKIKFQDFCVIEKGKINQMVQVVEVELSDQE
jgi:hypothetical protein